MKKTYVSPELEEISVQSSDILLASSEEDNDTIINVFELYE